MATAQPQRRKAPRRGDPALRGRRTEPRACIFVTGTTEALSGRGSVTILDVSTTGARVQGRDLPGVGRDIVLRCGDLEAFGKTSWAASDRCGIQFYDPIPGRHVLKLRQLSDAIEDSSMTPEEIQAAADWANGLAR